MFTSNFAASLLIAGSLMLAGCVTPVGVGTGSPLAGTQWRLVQMTSMDDAQPPVRPNDSSRYTLSFGSDGRASMMLDCNRGNSTWTSTGGAEAGSIAFGPIATTRVMCASASIGDRLGRQLANVRGYRLHNGKLHLSLMADAGIITWEPVNGANR